MVVFFSYKNNFTTSLLTSLYLVAAAHPLLKSKHLHQTVVCLCDKCSLHVLVTVYLVVCPNCCVTKCPGDRTQMDLKNRAESERHSLVFPQPFKDNWFDCDDTDLGIIAETFAFTWVVYICRTLLE